MQTSMYAAMMLISWFGAKAIVASGNNAAMGLTTGALTALFTYAMQILMSMMMLYGLCHDFYRQRVCPPYCGNS